MAKSNCKVLLDCTLTCYFFFVDKFIFSGHWKTCLNHAHLTVRRVKIGLDPPSGCSLTPIQSLIKSESLHARFSNVKSALHSAWAPIKQVHLSPQVPPNSSFSVQSVAYARASTKYMKQTSALVKTGATSLFCSSSPYEVVHGM